MRWVFGHRTRRCGASVEDTCGDENEGGWGGRGSHLRRARHRGAALPDAAGARAQHRVGGLRAAWRRWSARGGWRVAMAEGRGEIESRLRAGLWWWRQLRTTSCLTLIGAYYRALRTWRSSRHRARCLCHRGLRPCRYCVPTGCVCGVGRDVNGGIFFSFFWEEVSFRRVSGQLVVARSKVRRAAPREGVSRGGRVAFGLPNTVI